MAPLKVGVIGLGRMGQQHCRIYTGLKRAQLVGVADINQEVGRRTAQRYEVPYYFNVDELLEKVEAVSIVTPTPYHFDVARKCLEAGIPMLIEKPISETLEQAQQLVSESQSCGVLIQIGHIERFNPAYIELKNVLEGMQVLAVNFRRLSAYSGSNTDVDVVLDLMIHDTDLAIDLVGDEPSCIVAAGLSAYGRAVDHASAQLCYPHGPLLTMTASRITEEKVRSIEVTALDAFLEANLLSKTVTIHRRTISQYLNMNKQNVKYRQESILESVLVPVVEPLLSELQQFIESVIERRPPVVSAFDGMRALRLAMDIRDIVQSNLVDVRSRAAASVDETADMKQLVS